MASMGKALNSKQLAIAVEGRRKRIRTNSTVREERVIRLIWILNCHGGYWWQMETREMLSFCVFPAILDSGNTTKVIERLVGTGVS